MAREELEQLLKTIELFTYDPKEKVVFSGKSLRDVSLALQREIDEHSHVDERHFVAAWSRAARDFRAAVMQSARDGNSYVLVKGTRMLLIREEDAARATAKIRKGPDYPYPDEW